MQKRGDRVASLQGNLSQNRRQDAINGFRGGKYDFLVATDIAARGIDGSEISHVINFDMPDTGDAYTHRIGRTGRALKVGDAFTFATSEDTQMIRLIERTLGSKIERRRLAGFDYGNFDPEKLDAKKPAPKRTEGHGRPPHRPAGGGGHRQGQRPRSRHRRRPS